MKTSYDWAPAFAGVTSTYRHQHDTINDVKTYAVTPTEVGAQSISPLNRLMSVCLIMGLVGMLCDVAHPESTIANVPALASGEQDIPIHPMVNLNFKGRGEVLKMREDEVRRVGKLAPANYRPDPAIFQLVDGKPWWGTTGFFFYGPGPKSIEGLSEQSRYLTNPYLLISLREAYVVKTNISFLSGDSCVLQAQALRWKQSNKRATAYFNFSAYLPLAERMHGISSAREFWLVAYNARDYGFHYMALDTDASKDIKIPSSEQPVLIQQFLHLGHSCHYAGGCNNLSPDQPELHIRVKSLPATAVIKLWRDQPPNQAAMPDMVFVLNMQ